MKALKTMSTNITTDKDNSTVDTIAPTLKRNYYTGLIPQCGYLITRILVLH